MLELLFCSLLTIFPDYLYRRFAQGKRIGKEITLFSVWFELRWGIIACLMLTIGLITVIFYNHPVDDQRHRVLPHHSDPARDERARRRGLCRLQRRGQTGRADLPARQLGPGGGRGDRPAQDRRDRCGAGRRADRCPCRRGQDPGGQERPSAGSGRTGDQAGDLPSQPGRRRRQGYRKARGCRARAPGHDRWRHGRQADSRGADLHAPAGPEGERRGRAGSGRGGSGEDRHPRRRERAGGAVHAAGGRHRQPVHASGRGPDSGGRRAGTSAGRLRADRGAGHEGRHGGRSHLCLEALDGHPDGGDAACRTSSPRASSAAASN